MKNELNNKDDELVDVDPIDKVNVIFTENSNQKKEVEKKSPNKSQSNINVMNNKNKMNINNLEKQVIKETNLPT
ncbi:MAG TPA: hypothetical protein PK492_05665, partial [Chitinophagaceae bacterium]|nr:hypothetical protein [Chitinophagaceae bacterium]